LVTLFTVLLMYTYKQNNAGGVFLVPD
jgi:hypothetical protein